MPRYDNALWRNIFNKQNDLYSQVESQNPDVALGLYGEEARMKNQVGGILSASGSDVGGTYNKAPLFGISADFATRRTEARQRFNNERIMRLMGITNSLTNATSSFENIKLGYANLDFQKDQANTFNWAEMIPQIGLNLALGAVTGGASIASGATFASGNAASTFGGISSGLG